MSRHDPAKFSRLYDHEIRLESIRGAALDLYEALVLARATLWAIQDSAVESGFGQLGDIIAERLTACNAVIAKAEGGQ